MNAPAEPEVRAIPLEHIALGKNYRHRHPPDWDKKLDELGESMKQNGQLEPVLVRPLPKPKGEARYEVVFGERRYRGAGKAGLETLLAVVRDVPDAQILELQIAENADREDPHPLDEAEGFHELVKRGATPASISAIRGRDVSYVAKRLALLQLAPEGRKALDDGKVTFGIALLVARIPDKKLQVEALLELEDAVYGGGPVTVARAAEIIEEHFMLRLEKAPFDIADAKLVPKAGACTACPKRTGAQRELFADIKSADLCTDPTCHKGKVDALWQIRKKEATKGGTQVVEGKDAAGASHGYGSSKFISLDAEVWVGNKHVKVRKLFGKDAPEKALARDSEGDVFEVVPRADVNKVVRSKDKSAARDTGDGGYASRQKADARKAKLRQKAVTLAVEQAVVKAAKLPPEKALRLVVRAFAARAWNETQRRIVDRRSLGKGNRQSVELALVKLAKELPLEELQGLGLELAMLAGAPQAYGGGYGGTAGLWTDCLKLTGVNFDAIQKSVAAQAKEKKAGKAAAKPKATKKPKAKKAKGRK